jgi:hypothetical protein
MVNPLPIRLLFVGRNSSTTEELRALLDHSGTGNQNGFDKPIHRLEFHAVTNQKGALRLIRSTPPSILLVETDAKPNSRARFCEMVQYRLPTAAILAVSKSKPQGPFPFDSFIQLPLVPSELLKAINDICNECDDYRLQRGKLQLNIATRTVITPSGRYRMTPKQCSLLQLLMIHQGEVVKRSEIMQSIWQTSYMEDTRTLDVHIRWLRERIEPEPSSPIYLETIRGVGYRLNPT